MYQLFGKVFLKNFVEFDVNANHLGIFKEYESYARGFDPSRGLNGLKLDNSKQRFGCSQLWSFVEEKFKNDDSAFVEWMIESSEPNLLFIFSDIENMVYLKAKLFKTILPNMGFEAFDFLINIFLKKIKFIDGNAGNQSSISVHSFSGQLHDQIHQVVSAGFIKLIWENTFAWRINQKIKTQLYDQVNLDLFFVNYYTNGDFKPSQGMLLNTLNTLNLGSLTEFEEDVVLPLIDSYYRIEKMIGMDQISWSKNRRNELARLAPEIYKLLFEFDNSKIHLQALELQYNEYAPIFQNVFLDRPSPFFTLEMLTKNKEKIASAKILKSLRVREYLNPYLLFLMEHAATELQNIGFELTELALND